MMGADLSEMVTAPFSMHRTSGNEAMPRFMQTATEMFSADVEEVDMSGYVKVLQQKILSNFNPPKFEGSPSAVLFFKVSHNGRMESCKIIKSSGNELYDYAVVQSVKTSAPFEYLPSGYEGDVLKVQVTFTRNAMSINYF